MTIEPQPDQPDRECLLILGASARACAFSALRGGFTPLCGDIFADEDLRRVGRVEVARPYPVDLERIADRFIPADGRLGWMYTGGLENHPTLIAKITAKAELLGNAPETLSVVRDPVRLAAAWRAAGCPCPEVRSTARGLPPDGSWLRKRIRSAGGGHISRWEGNVPESRSDPDHFFQQYRPGTAASVLCLGAGRRSVPLGVTAQLLGAAGREASSFRYSGSIGPLPLSTGQRKAVDALVRALSAAAPLAGLFGVDLVMDEEDRVWPIEVNPRYTASAEVLERSLGASLVSWHVRACRDGWLPEAWPKTSPGVCGKQIVFAPRTATVDAAWVDRRFAENDSCWPAAADIPPPGQVFRSGMPLITALAAGPTIADVQRSLNEQATRWAAELG